MPVKDVTTDDFLNGKVKLRQSVKGLRATTDAVLVASAVLAKKNESLLDVGAGNGVIGLCVSARVPVQLTALEIQENLVQLIQENAELNDRKITVIRMDLFQQIDPLKDKQFHHVVTNPPFYDTTGAARSNKEQATAYMANFDLDKWLVYCLKHIRAKGTFTMIHRPEMLGEILMILEQKLGGIEIIPIYSKAGQTAKRVIIRGQLGSNKSTSICPGIVLHTQDDKPTSSATRLLKKGVSLYEQHLHSKGNKKKERK